jgi:hypothetical protein
MSFDFSNLKPVQISADVPLKLVIIGPSGAGKSYAAGTLGVKTLHLATTIESHGPESASLGARDNNHGSTIFPFIIDREGGNKTGKPLSSDAALEQLRGILKYQAVHKQFEAIILDGLTEVEALVLTSKNLLEATGKNKWAKNDMVPEMLREIYKLLDDCQAAGIHTITTLAATVAAEASDEGYTVNPTLSTFGVASRAIQSFPDILVVGKIQNDSGEKPVRKFFFNCLITKESKDMKGQVSKIASFSPRLTGLSTKELPLTSDADLAKLVAGRRKKLENK